jgi:hypothetical protein
MGDGTNRKQIATWTNAPLVQVSSLRWRPFAPPALALRAK